MIADMIYHDVLVGLELNEPDKALLRYLTYLQKFAELEKVTFLHVVPENRLTFSSAKIKTARPLAEDEARRKELEDQLRMFVAKESATLKELSTDVLVREGKPLQQLAKIANERKSDLVVIGSRANVDTHTIRAKNLIREVKGDVLVVPQTALSTISKIMVPIDFSDNSVRALQQALSLQNGSPTPVTIQAVNFYQRPDLMGFNVAMTSDQFDENVHELHEEGYESFVAEKLPGLGHNIEPVLIQEDSPAVAEQIMDYATEQGADLIIMGVRGHSKLALLILGSTTERLLDKNDRLPILLVK